MEIVQELFVTAFIAVFFSFIVAKLVSVAMAGDSVTTAETKKPVETVSVNLVEKLAAQSEKKVEFVQGTEESVDRLESESVPVERIVEETVKSGEEVESEHKDVIDVSLEPEPEKENEKETEKENKKETEKENKKDTEKEKEISREVETESESCEEAVKRESSVDDDTKKEVSSDCHEEEVKEESSSLQKDVKNCEKDDDSKRIDESEEVVMNLEEEKSGEEGEEDDDWEGIERSELEKSFAVAAQYVGEADISDRLDGVSDDVRMQLYGLHKVATEGPCRESQPMPLMLSARAKWNAWQRLGNMSLDVGMEQYINLLSEHVPGWKEETASAVAPRTLDTKSGVDSCHQPESRDAREPPVDSGIDEDNLNIGENTGIKDKFPTKWLWNYNL